MTTALLLLIIILLIGGLYAAYSVITATRVLHPSLGEVYGEQLEADKREAAKSTGSDYLRNTIDHMR